MRTTSNLIFQTFGHGTSKGFVLLFYILLPRALGAQEYGKFALALALSTILVQPLVEMGLDLVIAKWASREKAVVVQRALVLKLAGALAAIPLLLAVSLLGKVDRITLWLLYPYFAVNGLKNGVLSYFRGIEEMEYEAIVIPLERLGNVAFLFLFLFLGVKDSSLGGISLLAGAVMALSALLLMTRRKVNQALARYSPSEHPKYTEVLKEGLALAGVGLLWLVYFRIDTVMLGIMKDDLEVGIYNAAYKVMEGLFIIPGIIMLVFFPKLVKDEGVKRIFGRLLPVLGVIGLVVALTVYVLSPTIIRTLYGAEFSRSIGVLQTLSLVLVPVCIGYLTTQSLVALDLHRKYLVVTLLATGMNILLNYLLIPGFGANGAAWATLATEVFVGVVCGYFVWCAVPDAIRTTRVMLEVRRSFFAWRGK